MFIYIIICLILGLPIDRALLILYISGVASQMLNLVNFVSKYRQNKFIYIAHFIHNVNALHKNDLKRS